MNPLRLVELLNSTRDDGDELIDRVRVKYEEFLGLLNVGQLRLVDQYSLTDAYRNSLEKTLMSRSRT